MEAGWYWTQLIVLSLQQGVDPKLVNYRSHTMELESRITLVA